jgi:hypothetical protein
MLHIIKIILFLIVNLGGYFAIAILFHLCVMLGVLPQMPTDELQHQFLTWLFGIGTWVWLAAAFISIGYFLVQDKYTRVWLILAPLYVPFIFGIGVMIYFNYLAPIPAQ